ncbi:UNVERIFIED_CONTAM: Trappc3 [Trichonephila clavipes]
MSCGTHLYVEIQYENLKKRVKIDPNRASSVKKINHNKQNKISSSELFALTYGSLVSQILKDYENDEDVNKQLERMGHNIGVRIVEDFLARTNAPRCHDLRDTADKLQVKCCFLNHFMALHSCFIDFFTHKLFLMLNSEGFERD